MKIGLIVLTLAISSSILISLNSSAQVSFGIELKGGTSKLMVDNRAYVYDEDGFIYNKDQREMRLATKYPPRFMYGIEVAVYEKIKNSKISFKQGIGFIMKSSRSRIMDEFMEDPQYGITGIELIRTLYIPIQINYQLNEKTFLIGGISGNYDFYSTLRSIPYKYNITGFLGCKTNIKKNYYVGLDVMHNITPVSKFEMYEIFFHFAGISANIGYVF